MMNRIERWLNSEQVLLHRLIVISL